MDGIHDLGGRQGLGAVDRSASGERTFEAGWQRRVFGLALTARLANVDAFRHAVERAAPLAYLSSAYWERWLAALELLAREHGDAGPVDAAPLARRTLARAPRFAVGDAVLARDRFTRGHTRLPGYVRGRSGEVVLHQGAWVFPDAHAHGLGEDPQHVYAVRFEAEALWPGDAEPGTAVVVDLFEPYLAPAAAQPPSHGSPA